MFKFEHLEIWKVSLELYRKVAAEAERLSRRNEVFLSEQIKRHSLSIRSNIAEGLDPAE
jgi:four helix bundle protein